MHGLKRCCIAQEAHHVAAPTFSQALLRVNAPNKIALSATPHRDDGLTKVIEWFVGPLFFHVQREDQGHVTVETLQYECPAYGQPPPVSRFGKLLHAAMVTQLCEDDQRTALIVDRVLELAAQGRHIIVLSARRPHCEEVQRLLAEAGVSVGLYMGGMAAELLQTSTRCAVILGTYSMANEGLDIPTLDTIVLATPQTKVVQATGRILREGGNRRCSPLVVDIFDKWACFTAQYYERRRFYRDAGFRLSRGGEEPGPRLAQLEAPAFRDES